MSSPESVVSLTIVRNITLLEKRVKREKEIFPESEFHQLQGCFPQKNKVELGVLLFFIFHFSFFI